MADQVLKFGIPKGSLEEQTLELMRKSGWRITVGSRSYIPTTDDPTLSCRILRPQEMPRYIADGSLDAGITGSDWIVENNVTLHQVESFIYAKATLTPSRWVLCVRNDSGQAARGPPGQAHRDRAGAVRQANPGRAQS